jgi:hypothetical protein
MTNTTISISGTMNATLAFAQGDGMMRDETSGMMGNFVAISKRKFRYFHF